MPSLTSFATFLILLKGLIGFVGALSVIFFVWGLVVYLTRLGTLRRDEGVEIMGSGVGLSVTALFLIGLLRFLT